MALMYCPHCGEQMSDRAPSCPRCGRDVRPMTTPDGWAAEPAAPSGPVLQVPDYLVQGILVTLCCCLPFGIAGIVYAAQANARREVGDYARGLDAARNARLWLWIGFAVGLLFWGGYAALIGFAGVLAEFQ
jgi:hypothetical protein